jgi:predicted alpha/beta-hydrolase family hydrolase
MKKVLCIFILLSQGIPVFGQSPIYKDKINFGKYAVGFKDTVLVHSETSYAWKNYRGGKPFFVNIWYPAIADSSTSYLRYQDYWSFGCPKEMDSLKAAMRERYQDVFKEYGVCSSTLNWRVHKYRRRQRKLNELMLNAPVNAQRNAMQEEGTFPCILYHHGAWASLEDNSLFAEFMASHGYLVISSNYEWPSHQFSYSESTEDVEFIRAFASQLEGIDSRQMIYAGHSLGAQTGLFVNATSEDLYKVCLSFDSTVEGKPLAYAKTKFPVIDSLFTHHAQKIATPIVLFSTVQIYYNVVGNTKRKHPHPQFEFFRTVDNANMEFITSRRPLEHNNFISQGIFRSYFTKEVKQRDKKEIIRQREVYLSLLNLTKDILPRYLSHQPVDMEAKYGENFKFETLNK